MVSTAVVTYKRFSWHSYDLYPAVAYSLGSNSFRVRSDRSCLELGIGSDEDCRCGRVYLIYVSMYQGYERV